MDTTTTQKTLKNGISKKIKQGADEIQEEGEALSHAIETRAADVRDVVLDLKDRAELAIQERPYILPVAAAAAGFGVGMLVGSRLTRMIVLTAAGAMLSDTIRGQVVKIAKDYAKDLGVTGEDEEDIEDVEASVT